MIPIPMEVSFAQNSPEKSDGQILKNTFKKNDISALNFYRQYSSCTDPGEYKYLYENFPESLPELCILIKSRSIHPYAELPKFRELIPKERWNESLKYPTVKSVLAGLLSYDSSGFVKDRKPEDRLVPGSRDGEFNL